MTWKHCEANTELQHTYLCTYTHIYVNDMDMHCEANTELQHTYLCTYTHINVNGMVALPGTEAQKMNHECRDKQRTQGK